METQSEQLNSQVWGSTEMLGLEIQMWSHWEDNGLGRQYKEGRKGRPSLRLVYSIIYFGSKTKTRERPMNQVCHRSQEKAVFQEEGLMNASEWSSTIKTERCLLAIAMRSNLPRTVSMEQRIRNSTETEGLETSLKYTEKKIRDREADSEHRELF